MKLKTDITNETHRATTTYDLEWHLKVISSSKNLSVGKF